MEEVRSACENRASIACWISEKCPFALHTSAFSNCAERYSLYAMRAYMHAFGRSLFCMDHFTLKFFESHGKDRASIACHIPEHRPFACCVPKRFLLLLRSDLVSYATKAYMHACGRSLLHGSFFNIIEAHAKTAHRSLVRSLNAVPLPVACRSAFCCCCEVILFHTPQRRTCTLVDAVFCMDRFF